MNKGPAFLGQKPIDFPSPAGEQNLTPQLQVGLPVFLEFNYRNHRDKFKASVVGWNENKYLITTSPFGETPTITIMEGSEIILRYLYEGLVYGFTTQLVAKHDVPSPMWFLQFPETLEVKNLRRHPRMQIILLANGPAGENWKFLDLSASGALMVVDRPLNEGEQFELSFTLPDGTAIERLKSKVVRLAQTAPEIRVGINFDETDKKQITKINNYVESALFQMAADKRR